MAKKAGPNGLMVGSIIVHLPGDEVTDEDLAFGRENGLDWDDNVVDADEDVSEQDMGVGAASNPATATDPKKAAAKTNPGATDAK